MDDRLLDAKDVIRQSKQKFELYMAHKVRAAQQADEFVEIDEKLQQEVLDNPLYGRQEMVNGTTMMLVVDWKMKFENLVKAEGTNEHYGKRGISWHGGFGYYYRFNPGTRELEKVIIKADQIMDADTNQNAESVLTMVEAFLAALERD